VAITTFNKPRICGAIGWDRKVSKSAKEEIARTSGRHIQECGECSSPGS
jgi:hypothetical protein